MVGPFGPLLGLLKIESGGVDRSVMRRWRGRLPLLFVLVAATFIPARSAFADFTDVPTSYWDYTAITYVAQTHTWMQDYGTSLFKPTTDENRELAARALVEAYAPTEPIDPTITFPDLPTTDPFYPYANVAVKLGWIATKGGGAFDPLSEISVQKFDKAIVSAMGSLADAVTGLSKIHQDDGTAYSVDGYFAYIQLAHWLGLHYNHDDESMDLNKKDHIHRDEVAYSLWVSETVPSWEIDDAAAFDDISLPALDPTKNQNQKDKENVTAYALDQMGYPYVWGGEWNKASPPGYCCGSQPIGGMDCSGFAWWVMKKNEGNYNAAQYHTAYSGWTLLERVSHDMAEATTSQVSYGNLRIGDLMFFASDGSGKASNVDHVAIYLGNDWMIHSSGSSDGVAIEWVGAGSWYNDIFVFGRRLIGTKLDTPPHRVDVAAGDGPHAGGELGDPRSR